MLTGSDKIPLAAIVASEVVWEPSAGGDPVDAKRAPGHCPAFACRRIGRYRGRFINRGDDTCVLEFPTLVAAVACASEVQRALARRHGRLRLKVGVNLCHVPPGDVDKATKGLAYAKRLRDMAEPGGLCTSAVIENRLTGRRSAGELLAGGERPNAVAAALQWAALLGYFAFWMGLLAWRVTDYAIHGTWACWLPAEWLCN